MITEIKTDEELQGIFEKTEAIHILFTNPKTCAPCRILDARIAEQTPKNDVYVCDLSKHRYEHQIMGGIRSIPTLITLKGGDASAVSGYADIWTKINS